MNIDFIEALEEIEKDKGISQDVVFDALESALISSYKKNFGSSQNVEVKIDKATGSIIVYAQKDVVDEVEDNLLQIDIQEARDLDIKYQIGDVANVEITPKDFGSIGTNRWYSLYQLYAGRTI